MSSTQLRKSYSCLVPKVKVTVCDLLTGKVLLSQQVEAKGGWLKFKVPPELVLTQWRVASSELS
jgi:hypothetical protein